MDGTLKIERKEEEVGMTKTKTHDATHNYVKGRVVVVCSCGWVRRYPDATAARRGHAQHAARGKEER